MNDSQEFQQSFERKLLKHYGKMLKMLIPAFILSQQFPTLQKSKSYHLNHIYISSANAFDFAKYDFLVNCLTLYNKMLTFNNLGKKPFETRCVCETLMPQKHPSFEKHDSDI